MNRTTLSVFACIVACASILSVSAGETPVQLNLAGKAGLPWCCDSVYGVRINILHGDCDDVSWADLGVFNRARVRARGLRVGGINWGDGDVYGLSVAGVNVDKYDAGMTAGLLNHTANGDGLQAALLVNSATSYRGVQLALFVNIATEDFKGVQIGLLNFNLNSIIPVFPFINIGSGK